ncbi:unnamed protein product [Schistosoma turkestanicum]|nr:unnamed protein product [Schistosoma turkestanicum]
MSDTQTCTLDELENSEGLVRFKLGDHHHHHSLDDEDDDVDDVAIDSFDLDNSNSSINNPNIGDLHSIQQQQQLHENHARTGIGTSNNHNHNNNNVNANNTNTNNIDNEALIKVKLSSSQENLNIDISQTYPLGNIIQTPNGQTLFDITTNGQLIHSQNPLHQYSQFSLQQQPQPLNNPTELLFTPLSSYHPPNPNINNASFSPAIIFVPAAYTTTATNYNRMELITGTSDSSMVTSSSLTTNLSPNLGIVCSSISAPLPPLDENMFDISRLGGIENLMPTTMISSSTPIKQSSPEIIISHCIQPDLMTTKPQLLSNHNDDTTIQCQSNDDIRIDLRKTGGGSGRSVKLELRELLDLVLAAAAHTPNSLVLADSGKIYSPLPGTSQRPPVGLVTQLLWRARALDDRGPWILTFAMWWLMQHYFGIGSRTHHVRLRWGHLRLVTNVIDPLTGELCEAIEYVGPSAFTTVKACALLESNSSAKDQPVRRVYPSSGWGEAEIAVAAALASEQACNRPRVRPLDIDPTVPIVPARSGPNFVSLYKSFARHRQQASLLPEAPFYVQPLQNSASALQSKAAIAWFSVGALGKNRIGALMRNIVDKVVRPDMSRVATAALSAATSACVLAADRAALALNVYDNFSCSTGGPCATTTTTTAANQNIHNHNSNNTNNSDFNHRQQSLVDKLSCLLGTNMSSIMNTRNDMIFTSSPTMINTMNINPINNHEHNMITSSASSSDNNNNNNDNNLNTMIFSRVDNTKTTSTSTPSTPATTTTTIPHSSTSIIIQSSRTTDLNNSNHQFVLKLPNLVQKSQPPQQQQQQQSSTMLSSCKLSPSLPLQSSSSSSISLSTLADFRNQILYETSSIQQQQLQLQQQQQPQTFLTQENDRFIVNPINQLMTNSFVLLTTVDGHTFLAPNNNNGSCSSSTGTGTSSSSSSSSIYPSTSMTATPPTTTTNQLNNYILMPTTSICTGGGINAKFITSTAATTTCTSNLSSLQHHQHQHQQQRQSEQTDSMQFQSYQTTLDSLQQHHHSTLILSGFDNSTLQTSNSLTVTTATTGATNPTASQPVITTSRAFNQPVACHLISYPSSNNNNNNNNNHNSNNSNNAIPVNLILLSTSTSPGFSSSSPIILNTTLQPQIQHCRQNQSQSCNLQTIYQSDNRPCDFDFNLCAVGSNNNNRDGASTFIDSLQPLIIQRNDSNLASIVLNTNNNDVSPPVCRTVVNLMNSINSTNGIDSCGSSNTSRITSSQQVNATSSTPNNTVTTTALTTIPTVTIATATTNTCTTLPACNQIFYGRNSLRQQHQEQDQSALQIYETFHIADHQKLTAEPTTPSPMKSNYPIQNGNIVQTISCTSNGQLITIAKPEHVLVVGDGDSSVGSTQSQFSTLIDAKLDPSTNNSHHLIQQYDHLVTSSNSLHSQPLITFLPINNNYLFTQSNTTSTINTTNTTLTTTTTSTTTTTATSTTMSNTIISPMIKTTITNNNNNTNNKPDIYFEIPLQNRDLSSSVQTVYRLLYTDNIDRPVISNNETALINDTGHFVLVNNDSIHNNNNTNNNNSNNSLLNTMTILGTDYSTYPSSCASSTSSSSSSSAAVADHYIIDHLPNMINCQLQSNGYSLLSIPSTSSTSLTLTTTLTTSSMMPLLSIGGGNTSTTPLQLQQSKHSSMNMTRCLLQTSNQHFDNPNIDRTTTVVTSTTTATTTNITSTPVTNTTINGDHSHLMSNYHIKIDDSYLLTTSVMTTTANSITSKQHNHNIHHNHKNLRNNSLLTLPPLSSMTCHLIPVEPKPDQLRTLQSVINSASAFQCSDFPAYVEQLFRKGILSGRRPWCLNFTAWFINTLVFEVENRTEHVSLRWGDFRLCQTADGQTEYIYFINRVTNKRYYLAGSPTTCCALGYKKSEFDMKSMHEPPVRCPCPVTIFKELRDRRPSGCLDPYSKFYLQPRNVECPDANDIEEIHDKVQKCHLLPANSNWFTEHAWGKNKLGGLFAEASKLAGLPTIWLRKHRSRNFFPGGGGSGIGALGNLHHHHHHNQHAHKTDNTANHYTNSYKSTMKTMENEHKINTSKENNEMTSTSSSSSSSGSTHTEIKRRRLMTSVEDLVSTTTSSTSAKVVSTTKTIIGTMNPIMMMTVDQKDPNIVNNINILPSSMTILKPKETLYTTSTVS